MIRPRRVFSPRHANRARQLRQREGGRRGVFESRIDFGPGLRVYFGKDGPAIVILLGGGTKKRQARDIADAQACWQDYKQRK